MSQSSAITRNYDPSTMDLSKDMEAIAPTTQNERERLIRMQAMENMVIGGLYWPTDDVRQILAPREGYTVRILDVGSTSGRWAVDMAKEFPQAEVLGIDRAPANPSDAPSNCKFEGVDMMNADVSHLEGGFDLVHCARPGRWVREYRPLLSKIVKFLRPGGLYLHNDGDMQVYNENKEVIKPAQEGDTPGGSSWVSRVFLEHKYRIPLSIDLPTEGFRAKLKSWLEEEPNLENIRTRDVYVPVGWPGNPDEDVASGEDIGEVAKSVLLERTRTFRSSLVGEGIPEQEVDLWIREAEADVTEQRVKGYAVLHYIAARAK